MSNTNDPKTDSEWQCPPECPRTGTVVPISAQVSTAIAVLAIVVISSWTIRGWIERKAPTTAETILVALVGFVAVSDPKALGQVSLNLMQAIATKKT